MTLRRHHDVVEGLREHRCREEGDCAQCFVADIDEVMFHRRWNRKNAAWSDSMNGATFHVEFAGAGDDVLRLFRCISVPTEPLPWLNFIHYRGRRGRAMSAIDGKRAGPMNGLIVCSPDFSAFQFIGCNYWIHGPRLGSYCMWVNGGNAFAPFAADTVATTAGRLRVIRSCVWRGRS